MKPMELKCLGLALLFASSLFAQAPSQREREEMYRRYLDFPKYLKGGKIEPHWMADGNSFWYAEGAPENTVIWKVDPVANAKESMFDTGKLRQSLAKVLGHEPAHHGVPFSSFSFSTSSDEMIRFAVEDQQFELHLESYEIRRFPGGSEAEEHRNRPRVVRPGIPSYEPPVLEVISPDGRWFAGVEDHNLYVRSCCEDRYVQLTGDGAGSYEWDVFEAQWSPDGSKLAVKKIDEWGASRQVFIVDISTRRRFAVDLGDTEQAFVGILGWLPDGSELVVERVNATLNELELRAADAETVETRLILRESQNSNLQTDYLWWRRYFTLLADGKKFILMSQRNGWNHLYLYDISGKLIRKLTDGPFEVVEVVSVDLEAGWIYFTAQGDKQRPYDTHLYRVNLEGKDFSRLTEASGQHAIEFAPSKNFFLDGHSSVGRPPAVDLRRADGRLLQTVSVADVSALEDLKWSPPEEFVVKAADGVTDLHGVLYRPFDFDPNRSYPVIDNIYGAPALTVTPRTFVSEPDGYDTYGRGLAQAQLGFIVFVVDARGTPGRGREFLNSADIDRHVIADHVAVLKQLAAQRPYMDLQRVGIYGISFGGYLTVRALLTEPDVYQVGIAAAAPVDFTHISTNEIPSNLELVSNLRGKLLLIHGTDDPDVPFAHALKLIDALIEANRPYDLFILPEKQHDLWNYPAYWEAIRRYLVEHLKVAGRKQ